MYVSDTERTIKGRKCTGRNMRVSYLVHKLDTDDIINTRRDITRRNIWPLQYDRALIYNTCL